jgi:hypothetical protein
MSRFTFNCDQYGVETSMTFECETWDEAVENFELFLRGAGFVFSEGTTLQMVAPEVETPETKSMHYYSFERNR